VAGDGGTGAGSGGEARALEREVGGGEKIDFRTEGNARRSALGGSAAERGKEKGRGGPGRGSATRRAGARGVRSRPASGAGSNPRAARAGDVRRARTLGRSETARERELTGGPAQ
jgi:hypothetical protein